MTSTITPTDTTGYTWGIFTAEGMLEGALSYPQAIAAAAAADEDDEVTVDRECSEHPEQAATTCEECAAEDETDDEDEDEDEDDEDEDEL